MSDEESPKKEPAVKRGEDPTPYGAEYAKSGRAACKLCKELIPKDDLRLSVRVASYKFDGFQTQWFHFNCFWTDRRSKNVFEDKFSGLDKIRAEDRQRVLDRIKAAHMDEPFDEEPSQIYGNVKVEVAKTGSSKCQECKDKIKENTLRVQTKIHFFHVDCFAKDKQSDGMKCDDFAGFGTLEDAHKDELKKIFPLKDGKKAQAKEKIAAKTKGKAGEGTSGLKQKAQDEVIADGKGKGKKEKEKAPKKIADTIPEEVEKMEEEKPATKKGKETKEKVKQQRSAKGAGNVATQEKEEVEEPKKEEAPQGRKMPRKAHAEVAEKVKDELQADEKLEEVEQPKMEADEPKVSRLPRKAKAEPKVYNAGETSEDGPKEKGKKRKVAAENSAPAELMEQAPDGENEEKPKGKRDQVKMAKKPTEHLQTIDEEGIEGEPQEKRKVRVGKAAAADLDKNVTEEGGPMEKKAKRKGKADTGVIEEEQIAEAKDELKELEPEPVDEGPSDKRTKQKTKAKAKVAETAAAAELMEPETSNGQKEAVSEAKNGKKKELKPILKKTRSTKA